MSRSLAHKTRRHWSAQCIIRQLKRLEIDDIVARLSNKTHNIIMIHLIENM